jgi:hypothetical protein
VKHLSGRLLRVGFYKYFFSNKLELIVPSLLLRITSPPSWPEVAWHIGPSSALIHLGGRHPATVPSPGAKFPIVF